MHLLNVLDIHIKLHGLIYPKALFVVVSKLDIGGVLKLVNYSLSLWVVVNFEVIKVVYPGLEGGQIVLTKLFGELLSDVDSLLNLKILQVCLNDLLYE